MWREMQPDQQFNLSVDGHNLVVYSYGEGDEVLLCLNGGPGLPCDYLRDAHSWLKDKGLRVVAFDQLGTGASDRPDDPSLWDITRYVAEVETVRESLGLGRVHMLGHSWGGWLAIEYAIHHPQALKSLILENTVGDIPHLSSELDRLRNALGSETVAMMQRYEAIGNLDHPQYQAAITLLNYRHVCRLEEWPAPVQRSLGDWNMGPYVAMQGPNEFLYTGNLKDWNRLKEMADFRMPVLITTGQHDELTPACALRMKLALDNAAELHVFPNSSHMPFYEEPQAYFPVLLDFLQRHRG
ncbi:MULTISPECIES: proline iminopeptidase-family hydrolase [unclassified Pseudomonas]|uniref:proline iminopeptidase-family hydrolase n=1 Tax=unclassified Pseudomonas TaxID=196821 RepID=UPI0021C7D9E0|nr:MULTISPECIES: proline iminopeptidase-family hydrolase [unclassified Pseudomonas]MCU1719782.1 proline iminopeptidase-family hydrolase [Pseudomonas sp. 5P_5.1_Bac1]MCU1731394.1 proline iminopeptidase-family hydrolase [Pseudomonas sp. 20P_3.2_Bac4]MCU1746916.1 proline iminopeptidase-family hydrolase [Pseudomonas sp. 20P_3.2_Bac5]